MLVTACCALHWPGLLDQIAAELTSALCVGVLLLFGHLAAMCEIPLAVCTEDVCKAVLEPDHVSATINWPAQTGSLTDICDAEHPSSRQVFSCSRALVKELCELTLQRSQPLQVQAGTAAKHS